MKQTTKHFLIGVGCALGISFVLFVFNYVKAQTIPENISLADLNVNTSFQGQSFDGTSFNIYFPSKKEGQAFNVIDFKGKPVIIHFWAPWCSVCTGELPSYAEFVHKTSNFVHIGVVLDKTTIENVREFYQKEKIKDLPTVVDNVKDLAIRFKVQSVPMTIFIGKDGKEKGRIEGNFEWQDNVTRKIVTREMKK
ncbi:MAG: TlpA family protein disulfide reductase [Alphaproteobacteria bacterium]